ncbi:MAG: hypothetical protein GY898_32015 [Proteobacteria bacterium]|nr:hypothetical protein [Pseudomonadota bacterium]
MTDLSMTLEQWLVQMQDSEDMDFLKSSVTTLVHGLMELEVSAQAGAKLYERTTSRQDERNGYRPRGWDTRVGSLQLRVPKLRHQGYQPSFLEPRTRAERALFSVVQEAYIHGVSTRKVEDLVAALGIRSMDKSRVSRMCAELDEIVEQWRGRKLLKACPAPGALPGPVHPSRRDLRPAGGPDRWGRSGLPDPRRRDLSAGRRHLPAPLFLARAAVGLPEDPTLRAVRAVVGQAPPARRRGAAAIRIGGGRKP